MNSEICLGVLFCILSLVAEGSTSNGSCASKSLQSCSECVKDWDCYYCEKTKFCGKRPIIKPKTSECDGDWYSYKQCTLSGNLLLIIIPTVLGVLLVITICICYCCCCRKCSRRRTARRFAKEDARREAEREQREMRHAERVAERKVKHDEIRKKYGLYKDDEEGEGNAKYQRFDVA